MSNLANLKLYIKELSEIDKNDPKNDKKIKDLKNTINNILDENNFIKNNIAYLEQISSDIDMDHYLKHNEVNRLKSNINKLIKEIQVPHGIKVFIDLTGEVRFKDIHGHIYQTREEIPGTREEKLAAAQKNLLPGWTVVQDTADPDKFTYRNGTITINIKPKNPQPSGDNELDLGWYQLENNTYYHPRDTAEYELHVLAPTKNKMITAKNGLDTRYEAIWGRGREDGIQYRLKSDSSIRIEKPLESNRLLEEEQKTLVSLPEWTVVYSSGPNPKEFRYNGPNKIHINIKPLIPQPLDLDVDWIELNNNHYIYTSKVHQNIYKILKPTKTIMAKAQDDLAHNFTAIWSQTKEGIQFKEQTSDILFDEKPKQSLMDKAMDDLDTDYEAFWSIRPTKETAISFRKRKAPFSETTDKPLQSKKVAKEEKEKNKEKINLYLGEIRRLLDQIKVNNEKAVDYKEESIGHISEVDRINKEITPIIKSISNPIAKSQNTSKVDSFMLELGRILNEAKAKRARMRINISEIESNIATIEGYVGEINLDTTDKARSDTLLADTLILKGRIEESLRQNTLTLESTKEDVVKIQKIMIELGQLKFQIDGILVAEDFERKLLSAQAATAAAAAALAAATAARSTPGNPAAIAAAAAKEAEAARVAQAAAAAEEEARRAAAAAAAATAAAAAAAAERQEAQKLSQIAMNKTDIKKIKGEISEFSKQISEFSKNVNTEISRNRLLESSSNARIFAKFEIVKLKLPLINTAKLELERLNREILETREDLESTITNLGKARTNKLLADGIKDSAIENNRVLLESLREATELYQSRKTFLLEAVIGIYDEILWESRYSTTKDKVVFRYKFQDISGSEIEIDTTPLKFKREIRNSKIEAIIQRSNGLNKKQILEKINELKKPIVGLDTTAEVSTINSQEAIISQAFNQIDRFIESLETEFNSSKDDTIKDLAIDRIIGEINTKITIINEANSEIGRQEENINRKKVAFELEKLRKLTEGGKDLPPNWEFKQDPATQNYYYILNGVEAIRLPTDEKPLKEQPDNLDPDFTALMNGLFLNNKTGTKVREKPTLVNRRFRESFPGKTLPPGWIPTSATTDGEFTFNPPGSTVYNFPSFPTKDQAPYYHGWTKFENGDFYLLNPDYSVNSRLPQGWRVGSNSKAGDLRFKYEGSIDFTSYPKPVQPQLGDGWKEFEDGTFHKFGQGNTHEGKLETGWKIVGNKILGRGRGVNLEFKSPAGETFQSYPTFNQPLFLEDGWKQFVNGDFIQFQNGRVNARLPTGWSIPSKDFQGKYTYMSPTGHQLKSYPKSTQPNHLKEGWVELMDNTLVRLGDHRNTTFLPQNWTISSQLKDSNLQFKNKLQYLPSFPKQFQPRFLKDGWTEFDNGDFYLLLQNGQYSKLPRGWNITQGSNDSTIYTFNGNLVPSFPIVPQPTDLEPNWIQLADGQFYNEINNTIRTKKPSFLALASELPPPPPPPFQLKPPQPPQLLVTNQPKLTLDIGSPKVSLDEATILDNLTKGITDAKEIEALKAPTNNAFSNLVGAVSSVLFSSFPHLFTRKLESSNNNLYGGVIDDKITSIPNIWREEHSRIYREPEIIKLLSINPENENINRIPLFKYEGIEEQKVKQLLVLLLYWDIGELKKLFNNLGIVQVHIRDHYEKLISTSVVNNALISKFIPIQADIEYVLLEDLIEFYKQIINIHKNSKNFGWSKLFGYMIHDYYHWKNLEIEYQSLKVFLQLPDNKQAIDVLYYEEKTDSVVTYLKVRCDTYNTREYNQYYNLYVSDSVGDRLKSLYITGPDPNLKQELYNPNNPIPDELKDILNTWKKDEANSEGKVGTLKNIKKYQYGYYYGPFNKIFGPSQNNTTISSECTDIINSLKKNKSVCVIGYGKSGSGKTSSLIYSQYTELHTGMEVKEPGIILKICENLKINEIEVSISELYSDELIQGTIVPKFKTNKYDKIIFKKKIDAYNGVFFKINQDTDTENNYTQRVQNIKGGKIVWENEKCEWKIENNKFTHSRHLDDNGNKIEIDELGAFITAIITKIRIVRPTPNNPESSRSHVIIYLTMKLTPESNPVSLIVIDAAGVENQFLCDDPETRKQFLKLKLPKKSDPYYVNEQYIELNRNNTTNTEVQNKIFDYFQFKKVEDIPKPKDYIQLIDTKNIYIETSIDKLQESLKQRLSTKGNIESVKKIIDDKINNEIVKLEGNEEEKETVNFITWIDKTFPISDYVISDYQIDSRRNPYKLIYYTMDRKKQITMDSLRWFPKVYIGTTLKDYLSTLGQITTDFSKKDWARHIIIYNSYYRLDYNTFERRNDPDRGTYKYIFKGNDRQFRPLIDLNSNSGIENIVNLNERSHNKNLELLEDAKKLNDSLYRKVSEIFRKTQKNRDIKIQIDNLISDKNKLKTETDKILNKYLIILPLTESGIINSEHEIKKDVIDPNLLEFRNLYQQIRKNVNSYYGYIKDRCEERVLEGKFINSSLFDLRKSLKDIIKLNQRNALFQSVPIFNSPCLEFYCNKNLYNCFNIDEYEKPSNDSKYIFADINKQIGDQTEKLLIVIFGVINITKKTDNPPNIPYIDLTLLKSFRDELSTIYNYNKKINEEIKKPYEKIIRFWESYVKPILNKFEGSIGIPFKEEIATRYKIFTESKDLTSKQSQGFNELLALIEILEKLNSTSTLGTMDFLNYIKNSLHTDVTCNLLALEEDKQDLTNIRSLKNIITGKQYATENMGIPSVIDYKLKGGERKKLLKQYSKYKKNLNIV